jgi:uncharacterized membrane protein
MVSRLEPEDGRAADPSRGGARPTLWILVVLTLLAALLRFYRIGNQSLWIDEVLTLDAMNLGGRVTLRAFLMNIQGPLHAGILWLVSQVTVREAALRSVSAVASVATVPVVFLLGRDLFDRRAGLLAALFFAVSPFSIWYAQEARNYALVHAFTALSTLLVYRLVVRGGRGWAAYAAGMVIGLYLNLSAGFVAIGHNLFAAGRALRDRRLLRAWAITYAIIAIAFLPQLWGVAQWVDKARVTDRVVFAPAAEDATLLRGEHTFNPAALPYSVFALSYGYTLGPSLTDLHLAPPAEAFLDYAPLVIPAGLAAAAALVLGLVRAARNRTVLVFIVSIVCAVFGGAALTALWNVKPYTVRYVSVTLPMLAVVMGAGVAGLRRRPRAVLTLVIVGFCVVSLAGHYYNPEHWKEDVRSVARYIEEHERPDDVVVVPVVLNTFDFYYRGAARRFTMYSPDIASDERVAEVIEERVGTSERLWFIDARLWGADPHRRIPAYLRGRHELVERREFPNAELSLFRVVGPPAGAEAPPS